MRTSPAIALLMGLWIGPALADDRSRLIIDEENDFFAPHNLDRHYTQGLRLGVLSGDLKPGDSFMGAFRLLSGLGSVFPNDPKASRHVDYEFGQSLFTPEDKTRPVPDPRDRPYAGWLYGGIGFIQDTDSRVLDHAEVQVGIVGPSSLSAQTQNRFHLAINVPQSRGWTYQLHDEPGLVLQYERKWRYITDLGADFSADAIPSAGVVAGNIWTYGAIGGRLRFGQNLRADYGPTRNLPGPSGTDYINSSYLDPDWPVAWYLFVGTEGRAVARNIFLDGNSVHVSPHVTKTPLVGDFELGVAVRAFEVLNLSYAYLLRSDEFTTQRKADNFGTITASFVLPF